MTCVTTYPKRLQIWGLVGVLTQHSAENYVMDSEKRCCRSTPEDSFRSDELTLPNIGKYVRVNIILNPLCTQSCVCHSGCE